MKVVPFRELTYPIPKALLKMIFLSPRWDMLISGRVTFTENCLYFCCVNWCFPGSPCTGPDGMTWMMISNLKSGFMVGLYYTVYNELPLSLSIYIYICIPTVISCTRHWDSKSKQSKWRNACCRKTGKLKSIHWFFKFRGSKISIHQVGWFSKFK